MDDCYVATSFLAENAAELNLSAGKLAVAGDSAGGNLAAAIAHRARDESGPIIDLQVLIYPVIKPEFDSGSYVEFEEGFGLSNRVMQYFWKQYVGEQSIAKIPYAVPSSAVRMSELPKTLVVTAEYDVLRDEGERYAKTLSESGCDVTLIRFDGAIHGFIHLAEIFDDGIRATSKIARFVKKHFE
jgi:acetyl esterase